MSQRKQCWYRQRLLEVEAVHVTQRRIKEKDFPDWLVDRIFVVKDQICLIANGNVISVRIGDYIVRDVCGRISVVPGNVFDAEYELLE